MIVVVNTLTHHNGVIDHNAQHQQEGESGNHVQRYVTGGQEGKGTHEGHAYTRRYPQCNRRPSGHDQNQKHQQQAQQGRFGNQIHARGIDFRGIEPHVQRDALGQCRLGVRYPLLCRLAGLDYLHGICGLHVQNNHGLAIVSGE